MINTKNTYNMATKHHYNNKQQQQPSYSDLLDENKRLHAEVKRLRDLFAAIATVCSTAQHGAPPSDAGMHVEYAVARRDDSSSSKSSSGPRASPASRDTRTPPPRNHNRNNNRNRNQDAAAASAPAPAVAPRKSNKGESPNPRPQPNRQSNSPPADLVTCNVLDGKKKVSRKFEVSLYSTKQLTPFPAQREAIQNYLQRLDTPLTLGGNDEETFVLYNESMCHFEHTDKEVQIGNVRHCHRVFCVFNQPPDGDPYWDLRIDGPNGKEFSVVLSPPK